MSALRLALLVAVLFAAGASARADVGPGTPDCSVESEQGPDATCDTCAPDAQGSDACATKHATDGYKKRCSFQGRYEVWCSNDSKPSGCTTALPASLGVLVVAATLRFRRRRVGT